MVLAEPGAGPAVKEHRRFRARCTASLPIKLVTVADIERARVIGLDFRIEGAKVPGIMDSRQKKGGGCRNASAAPQGESVGLELHADFDAEDARFVDHRGQVVEVDRADRALVVGDVADEAGDVIAVGLVTDAQAALEQLVVAELDRFIEEEVDLRAVVPVGEDIDRARSDRMLVTGGEVDGPLRRLRQRVAVDEYDRRLERAAGSEIGSVTVQGDAAGLDDVRLSSWILVLL